MRRREFLDLDTYGYDWVDMGTCGIWATCNIGAHSPEEPGLYFAWGEIQGYVLSETRNTPSGNLYGEKKKFFGFQDYKWCRGTRSTLTKYCFDTSAGTVDNKSILDLEDDAAYMFMGENWRMAGIQDYNKLCNYCDRILTTLNGVEGYMFVYKYNENRKIFFPKSQYRYNGTYTINDTNLYYTSWLSNISASQNSYRASYINSVGTGLSVINYTDRPTGMPIRGMLTKLSPVNSDYVDFGLSVKWAICNIGAHSQEKSGLYFQWGEIQGYTADEIKTNTSTSVLYGEAKKYFGWIDYKWCNGTATSITKYCSNSYYGTVDNKSVLEPEDDAAYMLMGKHWRMPTNAEYKELLNICNKSWTTINGINGKLLTSTKNSKQTIFFPSAGYIEDGELKSITSAARYWDSSISDSTASNLADGTRFSSAINDMNSMPRNHGLPIKPVLDMSRKSYKSKEGTSSIALDIGDWPI